MRTKNIKNLLYAIAAVAIIAAVILIYRGVSTTSISIGSDNQIAVTPERISEIKHIGQWEFMSVVDEQVVDTIRHNRLMPDDQLVCIYYGTVRIGIDLNKAKDDWVTTRNDTVTVRLPKPSILDDNFIDEARTQVFYERGRWAAYVKDRMYRTATRRMRSYALTPANIEKVKDSARDRFGSLFRTIGAKEVIIEFE